MNIDDLTCPNCGRKAELDQNFCGDCGQKLKNTCAGCDTTNPPGYKFCGQCGKDLRPMGTLVLNRTGLVIEADRIASNILHIEKDDVTGKPLSVFIHISDRAQFFSKWNTALNSTKQQDLEVEFSTLQGSPIHTHLVLKPFLSPDGSVSKATVKIEDITDHRNTQRQLEERDETVAFIGSLAEMFHPTSRSTRRKTITSVLEKIGVLTHAQLAFIARIDPVSKLVLTEYEWQKKDASTSAETFVPQSFDSITPIIDQLQRDKAYIVENFNALKSQERQLWQQYNSCFLSAGSMMSDLIYHDRQPIGLIVILRKEPGIWMQDAVTFVKLLSQLIAGSLPKSLTNTAVFRRTDAHQIARTSGQTRKEPVEPFDLIEKDEVIIDQIEDIEAIVNSNRQFTIEAGDSEKIEGALPVYATNDGVYVLNCPKCDFSDSIAVSHFEQSGWILKVTCSCDHTFRVIREMRKTFRKEVRLPGMFTRAKEDLNKLAVSRKWNTMQVTNISKHGVNIATPMGKQFHVGDDIQLKFNLDNSKSSPIRKSATIKSIRKNNVGCHFQNSDKHDVTLGFYFL